MIDDIAGGATRIDAAGSPRTLDPFGFFEGATSRIAGLGGDQALPVADYAFHTAYTPLARGAARFVVQFTGLRATTGRLVVQVNMILPGSGAHARVVTIARLSLAALAAEGGVVEIACEGFAGSTYALLGTIVAETDAAADGLAITVEQGGAGDPFAEALARSRDGVFAIRADDPLTPLFDTGRATLAHPVSQPCTAAQFHEPAYEHWLARLQQPLFHHRKQWEFVYILQVLEACGMLRAGRRGLCFGVGREPLPALMASHGVYVVATDLPSDHGDMGLWNASGQHGSTVTSLSYPTLCDDQTLARHVSYRAVDMTRIPEDLVDFDFTWSSCAYEHLGSIAAGLAFVARSVDCLRPGGVAVHTTELNLTSDDDTLDHAATVLFRRRDMERLALDLIAAGHSVAPIRLDIGDTPLDQHVDVPPYANDPHLKMAIGRYATTSFGIIVRRGDG
jgi:hypothetical protein